MTQPVTRDPHRPASSCDPAEAEAPSTDPHRTNRGPGGHKATQFDGNPAPQPSDEDSSGLKPRDDTPAVLEKRDGPKVRKPAK